jgi:chromosome segregation ATPase
MNGLGMTPDQVAQQVTFGSELPYLTTIHSTLANENRVLESQKQRSQLQLRRIQNQLEDRVRSIQFYDLECQKRINELLSLNSEINSKKNFIQNLDNHEGYIRIKETAKKETKLLMQNNQLSTAITLSATIEAIRRYPDNQILVHDIVTSEINSNTPYQYAWMEAHMPQLLHLTEKVQDEMAEQLAKKSVNILEINHSESKLGVTA